MSEDVSATELTSQYIAQVTADLERNTKEQQRIEAEIAALQEQLAAQQRDHTVLLSIQKAIGAAPATAKPSPLPGSAEVPAPRSAKKSAASGTGKRARTKKAAPAPRRATTAKSVAADQTSPSKSTANQSAPSKAEGAADKPASGKAVADKTASGKTSSGKATADKTAEAATGKAAAAAKTAQPTLVELIRSHLAEQNEPRSAAEITTALTQAHPGRSIKTTVVRTSLEGLVAKSQAQRNKQGSSVFYTTTTVPQQPQEREQPAPAHA